MRWKSWRCCHRRHDVDWIDPKDRTAMGDAETTVDFGDRVLLGFVVPKTYGGTLGMVCVKCTRQQGVLPRRRVDPEDGA